MAIVAIRMIIRIFKKLFDRRNCSLLLMNRYIIIIYIVVLVTRFSRVSWVAILFASLSCKVHVTICRCFLC